MVLWLLTLRRFPLRTSSCVAVLTVSFLCFCCLRSFTIAYSGAGGSDHVVVIQPRGNFTLPLSMIAELEAMSSVAEVTPSTRMGGYRDDFDRVSVWAVVPRAYVQMFDIDIDEVTQRCFTSRRTALIATSSVVELAGATLGDQIPIQSNIYWNKDGTRAWPFQFCGTFSWPKMKTQPRQMLVSHEYLVEFSSLEVGVGAISITTHGDPAMGAEDVDLRYRNSGSPTISRSRAEMDRVNMRRIADVETISAVLALAVFVATIFVSQSLYAQSLRDRGSEFRTLNAIGFSRRRLATMSILESLVLFVTGCSLGLALAVCAIPPLSTALSAHVGPFGFSVRVVVEAMLLAVGASLGLSFGPWTVVWRGISRGGDA